MRSCDQLLHGIIISYVTQFNMDEPSDNIDTVLQQIGKRIGALMKGNITKLQKVVKWMDLSLTVVPTGPWQYNFTS